MFPKSCALDHSRVLIRDQSSQLVVGQDQDMYNINRTRESSSGHCEPRTPLNPIGLECLRVDGQCSVDPFESEHCHVGLQLTMERHLVDLLGLRCRSARELLTIRRAEQWSDHCPGGSRANEDPTRTWVG